MAVNIIKPKDRERWLSVRQGGIGSSEIASILGLSPYETAYNVWLRKRGEVAPKEESALMLMGHSMELAVADCFERQMSIGVVATSAGDWLVQDGDHPYRLASPDRLYWIDPNGYKRGALAHSNQGVLECKSTQRRIDPDDIPDMWFCQIQWQMGVGGYSEGYIAWISQGRDFGCVHVKFNPKFYDYMAGEADRFWTNCIIGGEEPALANGSDVITKYREGNTEKSVEASTEIAETVSKLRELRASIKEVEDEEQRLIDEVKLAMLDAGRLTYLGETLATWHTTRGRTSLDSKALQRDHPELYSSYQREGAPHRTFRIKT